MALVPEKKEVRELELYFIDNETNEPIPNINVFYRLEKVSPHNVVDTKFTKISKKNKAFD
jgi:hypothetical protein